MTDLTPVTEHVRQCVKLLNEWLQAREAERSMEKSYPLPSDSAAFEAVFELMDLDWDEGTEEDVDFREGYETCLLDIVQAIANEWHVELPVMKVRHESGK